MTSSIKECWPAQRLLFRHDAHSKAGQGQMRKSCLAIKKPQITRDYAVKPKLTTKFPDVWGAYAAVPSCELIMEIGLVGPRLRTRKPQNK